MKKNDFIKLLKSESITVNNVLRNVIALSLSNDEIKKVCASHGVKYGDIKDGEVTRKVITPLFDAFTKNIKLFAMVDNKKVGVRKVEYKTLKGTKYYYYSDDSIFSVVFDALFTSTTPTEAKLGVYYTDKERKFAHTDSEQVAQIIADDKQLRSEYAKKANIWKSAQLLNDGVL